MANNTQNGADGAYAAEKKWRQPHMDDGSNVPLKAGGSDEKTKIEIKLSWCKDLLNGAADLKCFCVVYSAKPVSVVKRKDEESGDCRDDVEDDDRELPRDCVELGRTEVISNSADPTFVTTFLTDFSFQMDKLHHIIVMVFDQEQKFLGRATFCLERILRTTSSCESLLIESAGGSIVMHAQPLDEHLVFCFAGKQFMKHVGTVIPMKKKARNPYIVMSYKKEKDENSLEDHSLGKWQDLWKSEARPEEIANFGFGQFQLAEVNGGNEDTPIRILAMNWSEKNQTYRTIGQVNTTIREMLKCSELSVMHNGISSGKIVAQFIDKVNIPTMAHYTCGNACSIDLMVAVDFTTNNGGPGNPNSKESLHHLTSDGVLNGYETSLDSIGKIFHNHSSLLFNIWGFGAVTEGSVNHRFPLGYDGACEGVLGLLTAYGKTVRSGITMSGPKLLRPTIDSAIERAIQNSQWKSSYSVLVVLCCDGKINDYDEVMEKISQASYIPLSIIFVGIGDGQFSDWEAIKSESGTGVLMSPSGNEYMRDVAHFVKLNEYWASKDDFVHKIVEKIPSQLVQYHLSNGIFPTEGQSKSCDKIQEQGGGCDKLQEQSSSEASCDETVKKGNSTPSDNLVVHACAELT